MSLKKLVSVVSVFKTCQTKSQIITLAILSLNVCKVHAYQTTNPQPSFCAAEEQKIPAKSILDKRPSTFFLRSRRAGDTCIDPNLMGRHCCAGRSQI